MLALSYRKLFQIDSTSQSGLVIGKDKITYGTTWRRFAYRRSRHIAIARSSSIKGEDKSGVALALRSVYTRTSGW